MLKNIYDRLPPVVKPLAQILYEPISRASQRYDRREFAELKARANGMLSPVVYQRLYELSTDVAHSNMVEVGAAHGASTIALAKGIKSTGADSTLYTFEKGEGGSRSGYGDKQTNLNILRNNLAEYGVENHVELLPQHLRVEDGLPATVRDAAPFSLLCIDADGNVYREFELLYDLLLPGAVIIIDDYGIDRQYRQRTEQYPLGGGKHYRTFCYTNSLIEQGFLWKNTVIDGTLFGIKPPTPPEDPIDQDKIDAVRDHLEADRTRSLTPQN